MWATEGAVAQSIYASVLDVEELDPELHVALSVAGRRMDRVQPDKKERVTVKRAEQYMTLAGEESEDDASEDPEEEAENAEAGPDPK